MRISDWSSDVCSSDLRVSSNTYTTSPSQSGEILGDRSGINLRGLGETQTLILVAGRRLSGVSAGFRPGQPNLNGIPLAAVERIEVLPTTSSAIYGGSATGGVIPSRRLASCAPARFSLHHCYSEARRV